MNSFLQSRAWEGFQRTIGRKTWRVQGTLVILHGLPFGFSYLYCPHPSVRSVSTLLPELERITRRENALFLKIDPIQPILIGTSEHSVKKSNSLQPQHSLNIDLTETQADLLSQMHPKTRYNIKVAEKHGVRIAMYKGRHEKNGVFETFWSLLEETAGRDEFSTHEKKYYHALLQMGSDDVQTVLFLALYNQTPVAGAIVLIHDGTAVYLHGASSKLHRNVMAPHLLHWRIIEEVKRMGCAAYDMWGIDLMKWPGVTRFKKGFGGREILYPESIDIVFRPFWYRVYQAVRMIRKK